jgi:hypothetical protein
VRWVRGDVVTLICVTDGVLGVAAGDSMLLLLVDAVEGAAVGLCVHDKQGH